MPNEAFFTQGGNYDGEEFRRLLRTFYYSPAAEGGVIFGLGVVVGAGSTVKVQTGAAFVNESSGGSYIGATQADSATITIPSASGSDRTDTIYAIILDPGSGGTAGEMAFGRANGTTTFPALSIPLAHVTAHVAGGPLTIVDVRSQVQSSSDHAADTGWVAVDLANGWTLPGGGAAPYGALVRRCGNVCQLKATIKEPNTTRRNQIPDSLAMQLPAWAIPTYTNFFSVPSSFAGSGLELFDVEVAIEGSATGQGPYPGTVQVFMGAVGASTVQEYVHIAHTYLA